MNERFDYEKYGCDTTNPYPPKDRNDPNSDYNNYNKLWDSEIRRIAIEMHEKRLSEILKKVQEDIAKIPPDELEKLASKTLANLRVRKM